MGFIAPQEAAEQLKCSKETVLAMIKADLIEHAQIGSGQIRKTYRLITGEDGLVILKKKDQPKSPPKLAIIDHQLQSKLERKIAANAKSNASRS